MSSQIQVPLSPENPTQADTQPFLNLATNDALLPATRFSPRFLLGAGTAQREMMGQLYATQIASAVTTKNPSENRTLLLGLGLGNQAGTEANQDVFSQIVNLVLGCI